MKTFIVIIIMCLFSWLFVNVSNAFAQVACPKTLEEAKKDKVYREIYRHIYHFDQKEYSLECIYWENGKLAGETPSVNDKVEGTIKRYYENGQIESEIPYIAGKKDGIRKIYYDTGEIFLEDPYVSGKFYGVRKHYYESGKIQSEDNNLGNGQMLWTKYDEQGKVVSVVAFVNYVPIAGICYKTNGITKVLTADKLPTYLFDKELIKLCE
ncbi:toxin-antitoxin system YwqK family antitoxin [Desulfovibrio litoralis]|uniref:MORN repeat variant n=1 Tax=Desulfovibrio litoralis DSM 11393 TaxID=1121455 RepID=A0A1M7TG18_9BACT|nr:toxin-antitoxin system YwqK family antitoxin [Desulfovibrio litoralis]SHN69593.1 MORN repeat variant [Desulfovibrio litoralis DSM 11393]